MIELRCSRFYCRKTATVAIVSDKRLDALIGDIQDEPPGYGSDQP